MRCRVLTALSLRITVTLAMVATFVQLTGPIAVATDYTWLGGGGNNNWGNAANWAFLRIPPTTQPTNDTTNVFMKGNGGSSDLANVLNFDVDWTMESLTFDSEATGSIDIIGGMLTLGSTFFNDPKFIRNSDNNVHDFSNEHQQRDAQAQQFDQ